MLVLRGDRGGSSLVAPRPKRPGDMRRGTGRRKGEKRKWLKPLSSPVRTGAGRDRHSPKKARKGKEGTGRR